MYYGVRVAKYPIFCRRSFDQRELAGSELGVVVLKAREQVAVEVKCHLDRAMSEQTRRLGAAKDLLQPSNELRRAVKQPKRLIARREDNPLIRDI